MSIEATDIDNDEDWELISTPKPDASRAKHSTSYVNYQLNIKVFRYTLVDWSYSTFPEALPSTGTEETIPTHEQEQSPFFRLPAELRLQIYELIFRLPATARGVMIRHRPNGSNPPSVLTSLLSCRRFLAEAEEIFYSSNILSVDDDRFWAFLGPRRRNAITEIALPAPSAAALYSKLQHLHQVPNLEKIRIIRTMSVKFIDPRSWAVMAPQIITELKKIGSLTEVRTMTPDGRDLSENDMVRKQRLQDIDMSICRAVKRRNPDVTPSV